MEEEESLSNLIWLQQRFDFSDGFLKKTAVTYPALLTLDQSVMVTRVNWLQQRLKLNDEELGTIIRRFPQILRLRPDTNLGPTLAFLQERLAFNTKTLSRVVQKGPGIVGKSITQTLNPNINWIQKRLHLNETIKIRRVVAKLPQFLYMAAFFSVARRQAPTRPRLRDKDEHIVQLYSRKNMRRIPRVDRVQVQVGGAQFPIGAREFQDGVGQGVGILLDLGRVEFVLNLCNK